MAQWMEELVCRLDDLNLSPGFYRVTGEMNPDSCALSLHTCALVRHTRMYTYT